MNPTALAGELRLAPGQAGRAVHSSRQDWVPRLTAGRPAASLPTLLGALFTLCGHAHRWTAERALSAARGEAPALDPAGAGAHRLATLREQLLRIHHDWPRLLPGAPDAQALNALLREAPVWSERGSPEQRLAAMPGWLAEHWLGLSPEAWLAQWQDDPAAWPLRWLANATGPLAELLISQFEAMALPTTGPSLRLDPAEPAVWRTLGECLAKEPGFALRPHWQGGVPDTGPWSRWAHRVPVRSAWCRLVARVAEVLALSLPGGAQWLAHGQLDLGGGAGLAWTEMARGLLVHRVQLRDDGQTVANAQVLVPTEWNCHPEGVLAAAIAALPNQPASAEAAARLAVAFDPCVPFSVVLGDTAVTEDLTCTS